MTSASTVEAAEDERSGRPPSRVDGGRRWIALIALAFFFGPAVAYVVGERARPIENRGLSPRPTPAHGWRFFPETSTWFTDHLPLRRQAIETNSSLTRRVFDEEPVYGTGGEPSGGSATAGVTGDDRAGDAPAYPPVVSGREGWLYSGEDFHKPCEPVRTVANTLARLDRLARMVEASGRRFVFTVAPNKSTVTPEFLPDEILGRDCWESASEDLWRALREDPPDYYVDLRAALERQQKADGVPIYLQLDTHWAPRAHGVYAEQLAEALEPGLWEGSKIVEAGSRQSGGDLAALLAEDRTARVQNWKVVRPGVTGDYQKPFRMGRTPHRLRQTSTDAKLFAPRTLLLADSFTQNARRNVVGLFADVSLLSTQTSKNEVAAASIADAEVVVLEIVERYVVGGFSQMFDDNRLAAIEAALD